MSKKTSSLGADEYVRSYAALAFRQTITWFYVKLSHPPNFLDLALSDYYLPLCPQNVLNEAVVSQALLKFWSLE